MVIIELENGKQIKLELYPEIAPETVANFEKLVNKGFYNGKATLDNGYGMFLTMLEYKLSDRNKCLVKVDKWFPSSQMCHACGSMHPEMKDLKIRILKCDCGTTISRDKNAAINILNEGLRILQSSTM